MFFAGSLLASATPAVPPAGLDEAALASALREAQQGSNAAFGQLYAHFSRRVFGLCRKMLGSHAAAQDATSEVFEQAHRALDRYDRSRPFDRWLFTIASNHCLNRLRRARTELRLFEEEPVDVPDLDVSASPLAACETSAERQALLRAVDELPENHRLPLVLRFYGDLSYDEIADERISRDNVAVSLHRAKRELRRILGASQKEKS